MLRQKVLKRLTRVTNLGMMRRTVTMLLFLALAVMAGACSGKAKRGTVLGTEVIRASDPDAQRVFDEGVQALGEERWADAIQSFRLVQSSYPGDPIANVAELYAARAGIERLAVLAPREGTGGIDEAALGALAQLASSKVDERIRWAAAVYYAAGLSTLEQHAEALTSLGAYPSAGLSPLILAADRPPAQLLIAESLLAAGRFDDAVAASGGLWHLAERDDLRDFAKSRAFEAAARLDEAALVDGTGDTSEFVRAVTGAVLIERRAAVASSDETEALQLLMRRVAPDLSTIDEGERLASISTELATRAPARRLAVAMVLPLTGPGAQAGRAALDGALVAADAYDRDAPTTTLVLVDSHSANAATEVARLRMMGVAAIIGPIDHRQAGEWAKAANEAEMPLFALTTEPLGEAAGDWGFRWFIDAESEARGVARVAVTEQGDQRIVILRPNIGYGRRSGEWFRAAAEAEGATIVLDEEYDRSATDYSRLAGRVARLKPDAIFIPDTATKVGEVTAFLAQANVWGIDGLRRPDPRAKRVQVHYLGTSLWNDAALLRQARSYVVGALIPVWSSAAFDDAITRQFFANYTAQVGREPTDMAAFAADGVTFVKTAFTAGATDPLAIREMAQSTRLSRGVTGATRFGSSGEPIRVLRFVTVAEGQFKASSRTTNVGLSDGS